MHIPDLSRRRARTAAFFAIATLASVASVHTVAADAEADRKYCETLQEEVAKVACLRTVKQESTPGGMAATGDAAKPPPDGKVYQVVDGTKVDPYTLKGFQTWRAAACDRCHGANQEGMVGPSLIDGLKHLSKDEFIATVTKGRLEKGMPSFGQNPSVAPNVDQLYAYLKGRSDGAITKAKVQPIE